MLHDGLTAYNVGMVGYFAVLNVVYTVLLAIGWHESTRYVQRRRLTDHADIAASDLTTPMSILVPAFNEAPVIVDSVRALLAANYPQHEVVVVNDGSRDGTFEALRRAFALVAVEPVPRANLATRPIRGVYASAHDDRLTVVDKENGGKSDSINAALSYARYPLFCTIDADTIMDDDALLRLVRPFQLEPETVACGGVVRVANGCLVRDSRVVDVRTSKHLIENIQIVEYLRAFLGGRTGWARLGALLIISGAFGVFRREIVVAAGGYDTTTVGEDAELVVRLHRYCREHGIPYRVRFLADPVCWTEAPTSLQVLCRQRNRWHRGLVETLWRHRSMIGRRRYGVIGLIALPYFLVFEALGPLLETIGYAAGLTAALTGAVDARFALALLAFAFTYGLVLSFGALLIEEHAFRRYRSWRCVARMSLAAAAENFGYRQLATLVRAWAFVSLARGKGGWGEMRRAGFAPGDAGPA